MSCGFCGAPCQGEHCKPCQRARDRDGNWQQQLANAGDLDQDDPMAFLGPDRHYCERCHRILGSLQALADHDCTPTIDAEDVPMQCIDSGVARVEIGPDPVAFQRYQAQENGGESS